MWRLLTIVSALAAGLAKAEPVSLTAADGVRVFGDFQPAAGTTRGLLLLFHMAGSNRWENAPTAAKLSKAGFATLAIDQRAGGDLFGHHNETVAGLGRSTDFAAALPDLEAAIAAAPTKAPGAPVIALGSSYSAALVFELARRNASALAAIMAFSPGEYLQGVSVRRAAASLNLPIFATSASDADEIAAAKTILAAAPSAQKVQFIPKRGVHGASTLREDRNPAGAMENWAAVETFLKRFP